MWGAVLDSMYLHTKSRDYLPERVWPILRTQVEAAIANWREPDRGIWEVRGEPKHFTSSKLMCWVALDRGARLAELREDWDLALSGGRRRRRSTTTSASTRSTSAASSSSTTTTALDASILLMLLVRFLPADDERIRTTVLAIADELTRTAWCSATASRPPTTASRARRARSRSARSGSSPRCARSARSPAARPVRAAAPYPSTLGLYAEEIDTSTGRHLGNFPQAFTHLALINAVMHVIRAEEAQERLLSPLPLRPRLADADTAPS